MKDAFGREGVLVPLRIGSNGSVDNAMELAKDHRRQVLGILREEVDDHGEARHPYLIQVPRRDNLHEKAQQPVHFAVEESPFLADHDEILIDDCEVVQGWRVRAVQEDQESTYILQHVSQDRIVEVFDCVLLLEILHFPEAHLHLAL